MNPNKGQENRREFSYADTTASTMNNGDFDSERQLEIQIFKKFNLFSFSNPILEFSLLSCDFFNQIFKGVHEYGLKKKKEEW